MKIADTTTAPAALFAEGVYNMWNGPTAPQSITFRGQIRATIAEAEADVAGFPKGAKVRVVTCGTFSGTPGRANYRTFKVYYTQAEVNLASNGTTGQVNETGIKRLRQIERAAAKLGLEINWVSEVGNSYATREDFEAGLTAQAQG